MLVLLPLLCLVACGGPDTRYRWTDESFDKQSMVGEGLVVLGVVEAGSAPGDSLLGATEAELARGLARTLRDRGSAAQVYGWVAATRELGDDTAAALLAAYRQNGRVVPASLQAMRDCCLSLGRYLVLARVERNALESAGSMTQATPVATQSDVVSEDGHKRILRVALDMFDLERGELVANQLVEHEEKETRRYLRSRERPDGRYEGLVGEPALRQSHAPPPPGYASMMADVFYEFARQVLPRRNPSQD